MNKPHRHRKTHCLECGKVLDSASPVTGGRGPRPGDLSICFGCHHIMVYAKDMSMRQMTDAEMEEIAGDPELLQAMKVLGEFKRRST